MQVQVQGKDQLISGAWYLGNLQFERDDGAITGFRLSGGRVLNLKFVRVK